MNDMFPQQKNHCSPVTPETVDTSAKLDFLSSADHESPGQEQQYSGDILTGHVDSALAHMDYGDLGDISESKGNVAETINFSSGLI